MANERFSKDIGVYFTADIDNPDWQLVVCTNDKSMNLTVDNVEINNDCTGNFVRNLPSTASWSFDVSGDANTDPGVDEVSIEGIFDLARNRTVGWWKFESLDETYLRIGEGYISDYTEGATTPEYQTFDLTISGSNEIDSSVPS